MGFQAAVSLTEQIAEHLGSQIISGALQPLERIQELKVAGELGVSRGSVREALLILESRHLVEIVPRRGAVVSRLEAGEIANFSELFTGLLASFFRKLALAPRGATGQDGLAIAVRQIEQAVATDDRALLFDGQRDFVEAGLAALNDYYLSAVIRGLIPASLRLAHLVGSHPDFDPRDTLRYHQALLDAISVGDESRVEQMVSAFGRREGRLAGASLGLHKAGGLRPFAGHPQAANFSAR